MTDKPTTQTNNNDTNIHAQHRQRMKARFLSEGLGGFGDHEILELLLYYALPRKDTNKLGHELIKNFGSLSGVFDAPVSKLCGIDGISEHSATLIKMIPALAKAYISDLNRDRDALDDYDAAGTFFVTKFIGSVTEDFYVAFLDNGMHLIDCIMLGAGDVNSSQVSVRKIATTALSRNASFVMIAHNHPRGTIIPSSDDLNTTKACEIALDIIGVKLLEHYIIAGERYMGIIKMRSGYDGN